MRRLRARGAEATRAVAASSRCGRRRRRRAAAAVRRAGGRRHVVGVAAAVGVAPSASLRVRSACTPIAARRRRHRGREAPRGDPLPSRARRAAAPAAIETRSVDGRAIEEPHAPGTPSSTPPPPQPPAAARRRRRRGRGAQPVIREGAVGSAAPGASGGDGAAACCAGRHAWGGGEGGGIGGAADERCDVVRAQPEDEAPTPSAGAGTVPTTSAGRWPAAR